MSLDLIRTNERMPDFGSAEKTEAEKIAELENYLIQLRDQIGWELDRLKARIEALERAQRVLAEQSGEQGGEMMTLFSMLPAEEDTEGGGDDA